MPSSSSSRRRHHPEQRFQYAEMTPDRQASFRISRSRPNSLDRGGTLLRSSANYQENAARKIEPWIKRSSALYDDNRESSDSSNWTDSKPPRPSNRGRQSRRSRLSSMDKTDTDDNKAREIRQFRSPSRELPHYDHGEFEDDRRRFHTIERSERVHRSGNKYRFTPNNELERRQRRSVSRGSYRSRSGSRQSDYDEGQRSDQDKSTSRRKGGLIKRTQSFSSTTNGNKTTTVKTKSKNFSVYDSVKSLYKSFARAAGLKVNASGDGSHKGEFDKNGNPVAPPRRSRAGKHNSRDKNRNLESNGFVSDGGGRRWTSYSGGHSSSNSSGGEHHHHGRRPSNQVSVTTYTNQKPKRRQDYGPGVPKSNRQQVARSRTLGSYDYDNRDPPKFEDRRRRDRSHERFFGDDDVFDGSARPAPDMRRLLLNNVNLSRRNSSRESSKSIESRPMIRAI